MCRSATRSSSSLPGRRADTTASSPAVVRGKRSRPNPATGRDSWVTSSTRTSTAKELLEISGPTRARSWSSVQLIRANGTRGPGQGPASGA
ncbi:hypothetical protein AQJ91_39715 [Streptomyces dysideae]|uniref:Uncharacterized protein n=1 Tax=Streptomyces dysideae TaxID=909626 RepID=A0A117RYN3_9ACTN|nr:hypothetical protein AQJ91_39715 [Streptomyces dysideae]